MVKQAKSGGLYSGLIDLDNLMDKGANKSCPQSKQTMASMQQKGGAQPHPSSSTAQQQPYYNNVSSLMGWGQSMGMQNPGMGMQNPGMGMQNHGMGYGMMPMYPMYRQYGMQPGMIGTGYGMNPGMQFQGGGTPLQSVLRAATAVKILTKIFYNGIAYTSRLYTFYR